MVSRAMIEEVLEEVVVDAGADEALPAEEALSRGDGRALPSPGMLTRHYAPRTRAKLVTRQELQEAASSPGSVVITVGGGAYGGVAEFAMPTDAAAYATALYETLRRADAVGGSLLVIEKPTGEGALWDAVRDRLFRATALS